MPSAGESPEPSLRQLHSAPEVQLAIDRMAAGMLQDYAGGAPLFLVIDEGARRLAGALLDRLALQGTYPELVFLRAARTRGSRLMHVQLEPIDPGRFENLDVLIVDDIADEGRTIEAVSALVRKGSPRSLRVAVLVSKQARRKADISLDYVGFELKDGWVVGVGMDLNGEFRDLDHLALVEGLA